MVPPESNGCTKELERLRRYTEDNSNSMEKQEDTILESFIYNKKTDSIYDGADKIDATLKKGNVDINNILSTF